MFNWQSCYISFLNLDSRTDRRDHMTAELERIGIKAERTRAMLPEECKGDLPFIKIQTMWNRTKGAVPCHFGQVSMMKEAQRQGKSAIIFEDDLVFCSDIKERLDYIEKFINDREPDFDVIWLGGTFHVNPAYWHNGRNNLLPGSNIGRDAEKTEDKRMMRTYGAFSTHAYIVNVNSIDKILRLFDDYIETSIGIDFLFIKIQPLLKTFAFVPGCIKQYDNRSDIGEGMTIYSGFARLNGTFENSVYWWQDRMNDFDPDTFNWAECNTIEAPKESPMILYSKEIYDFIRAQADCRTETDGTQFYNVFGSWQKIGVSHGS